MKPNPLTGSNTDEIQSQFWDPRPNYLLSRQLEGNQFYDRLVWSESHVAPEETGQLSVNAGVLGSFDYE